MTEQTPGGMMLLPVKPGRCVQCATDHGEHQPHNFQSLFWGMRFAMEHGRDPTLADCVAHLPEESQKVFRQIVDDHPGLDWTAPEGDPIAEPYARQPDRIRKANP